MFLNFGRLYFYLWFNILLLLFLSLLFRASPQNGILFNEKKYCLFYVNVLKCLFSKSDSAKTGKKGISKKKRRIWFAQTKNGLQCHLLLMRCRSIKSIFSQRATGIDYKETDEMTISVDFFVYFLFKIFFSFERFLLFFKLFLEFRISFDELVNI